MASGSRYVLAVPRLDLGFTREGIALQQYGDAMRSFVQQRGWTVISEIVESRGVSALWIAVPTVHSGWARRAFI
jgi:hypothetical protein